MARLDWHRNAVHERGGIRVLILLTPTFSQSCLAIMFLFSCIRQGFCNAFVNILQKRYDARRWSLTMLRVGTQTQESNIRWRHYGASLHSCDHTLEAVRALDEALHGMFLDLWWNLVASFYHRIIYHHNIQSRVPKNQVPNQREHQKTEQCTTKQKSVALNEKLDEYREPACGEPLSLMHKTPEQTHLLEDFFSKGPLEYYYVSASHFDGHGNIMAHPEILWVGTT